MLSGHAHLRFAFDALHEDFLHLLRYVEPAEENLPTFSNEIWSLYVRTCMEIETLFRQVAVVRDHAGVLRKDKPTIMDYRLLEKELGLEQRQIGMLFWRPQVKYVEPFASWSINTPPVAWYSTYHKVKHDREQNFKLANFGNLLLAFCGLFQVVIQTNVLPTSREADHFVITTSSGLQEAVFPRYRLSQLDGKA